MPDKKKQDRGSKDRSAASKTGKKSGSDKDDSAEGQLTPVRKKAPEPPGNLRRRAEWFKKRH
jgi:hypothetical protein